MQEQNQKAIDNALFKKLQQLTNKMPNDPVLYAPDVDKYLAMFHIEFDKVQGDTMKKSERFGELLIFLARSVKFFPEKLGWIPGAIMKLMEQLGPILHTYLRKKCVGSIMILRAKSILLPVSTTEFLLKQMRIQDKELRSMIYKYVLNDIRRMNSHHQNNKINQQIRAFISDYIPKHADKTSQKSLKLMIELYKKNIWTDNRSVNIIAEACFAPSSRLRLMACHFLMETTMPLDQLPDSDDEVKPADAKPLKGIHRQTKARENKVQKQKKKAARRLRKKQIQSRQKNFMPIDLIYNPQVFAEKLFNFMSGKNEKYAHKLIYMSLIARVIWRHQLILLPFYRALIKYLDPKQKDVNQVLTSLAQSVHEIVPEDQIESIVKHIIQHFVNDRCSEFTMTIGLNTLRQIFKKMPSIINQEMMLYLCTYYEYRNKNVSRAAKSVINFVRGYNYMLLQRKFRGNDKLNKETKDEEEERKKEGPNDRIPGVELLHREKGSLPIQMDRILTDDDFKKMRRLMRRQEEELQKGNVKNNQIQYSDDQDCEAEQQEEEEEGEEGEDEQLQIDSDECQEIQVQDQLQQIDGQEDGEEEQLGSNQQEQDQLESDSDNGDASVIDWQDGEQIQLQEQEEEQSQNEGGQNEEKKPTKKTKKIIKQSKKDKKSYKLRKNKIKQQQQLDSEDQQDEQDYESQQDFNPHGFINSNQISYYKMSKTELKATKTEVKQAKQKFKHNPKEKKGGTNDREKKRLKPLMMIRAKKNKIRSNQKQLKTRIKHLKNQLGKVRSTKEAKKQKNKIIHKKQ